MEEWMPMPGRVIVRKTQPGTVTLGGILIPATAEDLPTSGVVVAVNEGDYLQVGDEVVFSPRGGMESPAFGPGIAAYFPQEIMAYRRARQAMPVLREHIPLPPMEEREDEGKEE